MKIYPDWKRTTFSFLFFAFLFLVLAYLGIGSKTLPPTKEDYLLFGIWIIGTSIFIGASLSFNYFQIDKKGLYFKSFRKLYFYPYEEIIYIDKEKAKKSSILILVTKKGKKITLTLDKKKKILQQLEKSCKQLYSKEEICLLFPHLRP